MKNIISYSLFGDSPRYNINMIINCELGIKLYPKWIICIYYDNTVPENIITKLKSYSNVVLFKQDNKYTKYSKLLWRFYAYDLDTKVIIFRDADSYLSQREKFAVDDWLQSKKNLHIMREVYPGHNSKIMAGMWGILKNEKINSMKEYIERFNILNKYDIDQTFLNKIIYPIFKNDMTVHDEYSNIRGYNDSTNVWPSPIIDDEYIGRVQYPPSEKNDQQKNYNKLLKELY